MSKKGQKSYGIGAVVRRTGLSAPNIRIWEKRYGAVVPERTDTNRRLYSEEDLERLTLLHTLTERGYSISNIANLSLDQLREHLAEEESTLPISPKRRGGGRHNRVLAVGDGLAEILVADNMIEAECLAQFCDLSTASSALHLPTVDLLVIAMETLFPDSLSTLRDLVRRTEAPRSILIYHFAASKTATALVREIPGLQLLAAPLRDNQLRRECLVQLDALLPPQPGKPADPGPVPERLYSAEQLSRLARMSSIVECECPRHLAGLLQSLAAFEKYSRECEDRNPQDALLHAFLHRATGQVRRSIEEALQHVVQSEGITLD